MDKLENQLDLLGGSILIVRSCHSKQFVKFVPNMKAPQINMVR